MLRHRLFLLLIPIVMVVIVLTGLAGPVWGELLLLLVVAAIVAVTVSIDAWRWRKVVPGLMKVAAYHHDEADYDCRPKWMAVAALARQESDEAVPLLISLVDHGNLNTRLWSQAALARKTGQNFRDDKQGWAGWWEQQGHDKVDAQYLEPWTMPGEAATTHRG